MYTRMTNVIHHIVNILKTGEFYKMQHHRLGFGERGVTFAKASVTMGRILGLR
jgi:hypothetical protein